MSQGQIPGYPTQGVPPSTNEQPPQATLYLSDGPQQASAIRAGSNPYINRTAYEPITSTTYSPSQPAPSAPSSWAQNNTLATSISQEQSGTSSSWPPPQPPPTQQLNANPNGRKNSGKRVRVTEPSLATTPTVWGATKYGTNKKRTNENGEPANNSTKTCGCQLKRSVMSMAIIDLIVAFICCIVTIVMLMQMSSRNQDAQDLLDLSTERERSTKLFLRTGLGTSVIIILASIGLIIGAHSRTHVFAVSSFVDLELTWETNDPDFTPCFQRTALVWIPCGFLWLFAALEIYSALRSRTRNIPWTPLNLIKCGGTCIIIILCLLELAYVVYREYNGELLYPVDRYTPLIKLGTFVLVLFLDLFNRIHGRRSSGLVFLFWLILAICEIPAFRAAIRNPDDHPKFQHLYFYIIEIIYFPLVVAELLLNCWADEAPVLDDNSYIPERPSPEIGASFLSRVLFFWFESLARRGYSKPLEFTDLWDLNPENASKTLNPIFNSYWERAAAKTKSDSHSQTSAEISFKKGESVDMKSPPPKKSTGKTTTPQKVNIFLILCKAFPGSFVSGAFYKLVTDMLTFVPPMILNLLISHVQGNEPSWKGFLYAAILFLSSFGGTLFGNQYFYKMQMLGLRIRTVIVGGLYKKALLISNASREESTVGEIVNLMSVDAQKLTDMCLYLNALWSSPLQIGLSLYFLWALLGPSVIAGVVIMILLIPINMVLASSVQKFQAKLMKNKDQRIKLMNEILSGIKVLKLYAWETSFEEQISKIREKELHVLRQSALLTAGSIFLFTCAPFLVTLVTFATYVLTGNELDAQKAFVSLTLFNIMRMPLNMLSMVVVSLVQAVVSVKRINKYMNSEDIDDESVGHNNSENDAIIVENGNFAWKQDTPILKDVNLRVKEGALVAVVGSVGVGKSTLLSAILGEVDKHTGRVNTKGRIAYVAQQAWIQNATVRDNILFGLPFEHAKYDKVIESCALIPDLEILPASDKTEIGEKGINLSGGQKQRVALARATYNNADVYLLDDPLSAVDSHVGKHLFDKVLGPNGMLRRKTRLLVTHSVTYLPDMDHIIVLKNGEISETGTYRELLDKKGAFAEFLIQHIASAEETLEPNILSDLEGVMGSKEELRRKMSQITESGEEGGLVMRQFSRQISTLSQASGDGRSRSKERRTSKISQFTESIDPKDKTKGKHRLIELEGMETGTVKFSILVYYMRSIGWPMCLAIIILQVFYQGFSVGSNLWLSDWSSQTTANETMDPSTRDMYLGVYGGLGAGQGLAIFTASVIMAIVTLKASRLIHTTMLNRILKAPMSFFDTTPTGRIVNRFAKDVDVADSAIPMTFAFWLNCLLSVVATLGIICYSTPIFIAVVIPVAILYFFAQRYYVATLRQLRRLESVSRSPIYSHFGETLNGTVTIRAFGMQERFMQESEGKVDSNQTCAYPSLIASRYISVCLELLGNVVVFFAAIFAVMSRETLSPGTVGLSVSYALTTTAVLNWLVRMTSDVETNLVSVERMKEYGEIVQEADWESTKGRKPAKHWPEEGEIIFDRYQTRYRDGLDLVLSGVSCTINPGEKVGIVGRTGAGKSSLTLGLFRIIEAAGGSITIDGHDISKLGLRDLRSRLTIIPQDPVIFSGTLRMNLDPFEEHRDEAIWRALEQAHLKPFVKGLHLALGYELTEGGENLSVGQRQLVCLARALLRKTKILVLDEATAAVDLETDDIIQATIREEFKDSTIVTIAHRLNTIMDYTRVMVLDNGKIREFDSPASLLQNKKSLFYGMAKDAGLA